MKSFKHDETVSYIDISQPLGTLQEHPILQLNRPQEMNPDILSAFERGAKEIKIVSEDHQTYLCRVISIDKDKLVVRFPDSLKVHLTQYVLLVFCGDDFEYVIQGFVRRFFFPMVVVSYTDARRHKRWKLELTERIEFNEVPEGMLQKLMLDELELIRLSSVFHPPRGGKAILAEKTLSIEDQICSGVLFDSNFEKARLSEAQGKMAEGQVVIDYQEEPEMRSELIKEKLVGSLFDISASGLGVLSLKGCEMSQAGTLVYIHLPPLPFRETETSLVVIQMSLFGVVRYQRPIGDDGFVLSGLQFLRPIDDLRFHEFLEREGTESTY